MISPVQLKVPVSLADHSLGPKNAPLSLVKYGDYECQGCCQAFRVAQFVQKAFRNDLRFTFRNFPLTQIHPNALNAAKAAEAAALQNKFWLMHDLIFENQHDLSEDALLSYASALDLDINQFMSDMANPEIEERIGQEMYGGTRSGVNGTPTFYINGFRYDGSWDYNSMMATLRAIQEELPRTRLGRAG